MAADDRADIVDQDILLKAERLFDLCCKRLRILEAVAVADEDRLIGDVAVHRFLHPLEQCLERSGAPAALADEDQVTLVIDMQHRFNAQHRAEHRRRLGNAAAAVQVHQVVDREPVAQVQPVFLQPAGVVLDRHTFVAVHHRVVGQQPLAQRRRQAVHHDHLAAGIFLHEFLGALLTGCIGTAQPARKANMQHILTRGDKWLDKLLEHKRSHLHGRRRFALPQSVIKFLGGQVVVRTLFIAGPADHKFRADNGDVVSLAEFLRQVAGGFGHDAVAHCKIHPFAYAGILPDAALLAGRFRVPVFCRKSGRRFSSGKTRFLVFNIIYDPEENSNLFRIFSGGCFLDVYKRQVHTVLFFRNRRHAVAVFSLSAAKPQKTFSL